MKKKLVTIAFLVIAILTIVAGLSMSPSSFEGLTNKDSTEEGKASSYSQTTNHFAKYPDPKPVEGKPTSTRINQFFAHR